VDLARRLLKLIEDAGGGFDPEPIPPASDFEYRKAFAADAAKVKDLKELVERFPEDNFHVDVLFEGDPEDDRTLHVHRSVVELHRTEDGVGAVVKIDRRFCEDVLDLYRRKVKEGEP
jgi:hypothetical protein